MILHGVFGSARNWQSFARSLAESHRVITVDLRNHGQSEHADSMTYFDMAEDIHALITDLCLDKVTLIGHSMGGKVAMIAALQKSVLIERLIVLDIAPVKYDRNYTGLFKAMSKLPLNTIKNRNEADQYMNEQINDAWLSQFLLQNLVQADQMFQWQFNLAAIQSNIDYVSDFPALSTQYNGPTLFLGGTESDFINEEYHGAIRNYFPTAAIEMIAQAGHMLHIEQPEVLLDKIKSFLNQ